MDQRTAVRKVNVRKPPITLSSLDLDRIEALLAAIPASALAGKAELQAELDRADASDRGHHELHRQVFHR